MKIWKYGRAAVSVAAVVVALVLGGRPAGADEHVETRANTYQLLGLFGDVFERIKAEYVETPSDRELIEAAISGMLASLDPHSSYMNAKSYQEMQVNTRGEFGGLGIQVTMQDGFVKVISPIDDTPAFHAGVEAGDLVTHLDGEAVQGLTLSEAVDKMRGEVGTTIHLTIRRENVPEAIEVSVTRAVIKITSVRSRLEGNVGYLRITSFNQQTDGGVKKALKEFKEKLGDKWAGVVLDLRNNPGGLLDQAVNVSAAFLSKGEVVSTRSRDPDDTRRYNARGEDLADGKPIVVLINGGSASASEIVAGALQDHGRAILMGTRSFGKGSVQTIMPLSDQGAMRLTTARYYTPSGRSIQAKGIDPDILVEQARLDPVDTAPGRREADLRNALKNPDDVDTPDTPDTPAAADDDTSTPSGDEAAKDEPVDYQLSRALDLLRGLSLYSANVGKSVN
jgi:carboxyl-terminal processing protease